MISDLLIKILTVAFIIIAVVCALERNWPRVIYWTCAAGINVALLTGMK